MIADGGEALTPSQPALRYCLFDGGTSTHTIFPNRNLRDGDRTARPRAGRDLRLVLHRLHGASLLYVGQVGFEAAVGRSVDPGGGFDHGPPGPRPQEPVDCLQPALLPAFLPTLLPTSCRPCCRRCSRPSRRNISPLVPLVIKSPRSSGARRRITSSSACCVPAGPVSSMYRKKTL